MTKRLNANKISRTIRRILHYRDFLCTKIGTVTRRMENIYLDGVLVNSVEGLEKVLAEVEDLSNWFPSSECPEYQLLLSLGDNVKIDVKDLGLVDKYLRPINYIRTYVDYREIIAFHNPLECVYFRDLPLQQQEDIRTYIQNNYKKVYGRPRKV